MRAAIVALTEKGAVLARRLTGVLEDTPAVFLPEKIVEGSSSVSFASPLPNKQGKSVASLLGTKVHFFQQLAPTMADVFQHYDVVICVMATGIVVRILAPLLKDKLSDPAVLVLDERGKFVISLLSGHMGGANAYARRLSAAIGAQPVITTATDVEGEVAPDSVAEELALCPWPKERIKTINSSILAHHDLLYVIDEGLRNKDYFYQELSKRNLRVERQERKVWLANEDHQAVIAEEEELPDKSELPAKTLFLLPRNLIAGIGCRKGVSKELIRQALEKACHTIGRGIEDIRAMASVTIKAQEQGLLDMAQALRVPINFYAPEDLQKQVDTYHLLQSDFVKAQIGVGNVCEAAALCEALSAGGVARFALPKTKYEKVTVALLWQR